MNIENRIPDNKPEQNKNSAQQNNFTRNEEKLITEFNSSKKYYTLNYSNFKEETTKNSWEQECTRIDFFEKNHKEITTNSDKYPTLYPVLEAFLENNKKSVDNMFRENLASIFQDSNFSTPEKEIMIKVHDSETMQNRLKENPEKNKHIVWNHFVDISQSECINIMTEEGTTFSNYPNLIPWYIDQQWGIAEYEANHWLYDLSKNRLNNLTSFINKLPPETKVSYEKSLEIISKRITEIDNKIEETSTTANRNNLMSDIRLHNIDNISSPLNKLFPEKITKEYFSTIEDKIPDLFKLLYEEAKILYQQEENNRKYSWWLKSSSDMDNAKFYMTIINNLKNKLTDMNPDIFSYDMFWDDFFKDVETLNNQIEGNDVSEWFFYPNPVNRNENLHILLWSNNEEFDTLDIFDTAWRQVYINNDIQSILEDDYESKISSAIPNAKKINFIPATQIHKNISSWVYIFRLSSKNTGETKTFKIMIS